MCFILNSLTARCFTFGIGSGASTALVEGLARAGNGSAEFVKEGERLQPKVYTKLFVSFVYLFPSMYVHTCIYLGLIHTCYI